MYIQLRDDDGELVNEAEYSEDALLLIAANTHSEGSVPLNKLEDAQSFTDTLAEQLKQ